MTADERLTLRVVVPDATRTGESVEVRVLVGGRDILADAFAKGPGEDPRYLLVPVRLAEQLLAADPRQAARLVGGSPEFATRLSYA
ncbi:hypothetical protein AB0L47_11305 [Streptomyces bobili]|uniref:hypothetical protein n=1 Tax=Streptomyces bobili TaxID=67280 RepID=UPI0034484751